MNTAERVLLTDLKNQERINEIRTNLEVRKLTFIRSPMIRRWLLREFNFVTCQLYLLSHTQKATREQRTKLNGLLEGLNFAAEMLEGDTEFYDGEINEDVFPGAHYEVRLVSREANLILRALERADEAVTKLYMSEFKELINKEQREQLQAEFTSALVMIKQFSTGHVPKTLSEHVEEIEIS